MRTILVSLVSDQTLPNVQLIKEFKDQVDEYFFISTKSMEAKGNRKWIEKASQITKPTHKIEVEVFSFDDINKKLDGFDFSVYDKIIVNLTGGTKVMTMAAEDYFKQLGADIYYITGFKDEYIKVFPGRSKEVKVFTHSVTLTEYLEAHGFSFSFGEMSGIPLEYTYSLFHKFVNESFDDYTNALSILRNRRNRGIGDLSKQDKDLSLFLNWINFTPEQENKLSKTEVRYLSGDWFEEFIGLTIKKELDLNENELQIGVVLNKEQSQFKRNSPLDLIGDEALIQDHEPNNEIDVMFTYKNKFYTIECKTSIINYVNVGATNADGSIKLKEQNILGDTIYKADYLKNRFGLYAQSNIVTLTHIQNYIEAAPDKVSKNNKSRSMEELINRCNLSNIKLIDQSLLMSDIKLSEQII